MDAGLASIRNSALKPFDVRAWMPPTRIQVVAPDPEWPFKFQQEAAQITAALGSLLAAVHHIGSTSIPGIFVKPIIDILLEVPDTDRLDAIGEGMQTLGYEGMGEFGIAGRRYFRKSDASGVRTHHVHAFATGDLHVHRHLAFRDYLIAHPDIASEYSALKQRLAAQHSEDIDAYMDGKDPFIKAQEANALAWRRSS